MEPTGSCCTFSILFSTAGSWGCIAEVAIALGFGPILLAGNRESS